MRYYFLIQSFLFTLLLLTVVAVFIGKFVFQTLVLVTEWLCKAIYRLCSTWLKIFDFVVSDDICRLSTFYSRSTLDILLSNDFRLFTLDSRLFTLDSRFFTLDPPLLLSTYTLDSRPSTFRYTRFPQSHATT